MIRLIGVEGKIFVLDLASDMEGTISLTGGISKDVDENICTLEELKYIETSFKTKRVSMSGGDISKVVERIATLSSSSGGGGGIDPALLGLKEDKSNKTTTISGTGSNISYPTTSAVVNYMNGTLTSFKTSLELNTYARLADMSSRLSTKVDKTQLIDYPTTVEVDTKINAIDLSSKADKLVEIPRSALDIPVSMGIPLYTLDTGGNYILCEPDFWVDIGNGMCIPAYSKSKLQSV